MKRSILSSSVTENYPGILLSHAVFYKLDVGSAVFA